jgi:hypothetical protein
MDNHRIQKITKTRDGEWTRLNGECCTTTVMGTGGCWQERPCGYTVRHRALRVLHNGMWTWVMDQPLLHLFKYTVFVRTIRTHSLYYKMFKSHHFTMALAYGTIINAYILYFITHDAFLIYLWHGILIRKNKKISSFAILPFAIYGRVLHSWHPPSYDPHLHRPKMSNPLPSPALGPTGRTCTRVTCGYVTWDKHQCNA